MLKIPSSLNYTKRNLNINHSLLTWGLVGFLPNNVLTNNMPLLLCLLDIFFGFLNLPSFFLGPMHAFDNIVSLAFSSSSAFSPT
jgi:hypothetical protein